ncbi:alkylhydroperoxidase [Kitasatospora sp. MMS16-BH015]|uniref:carboxymuconolactone decarboxylase family protein n=1 Tax=Kitasatospora sp. MMS16-BH015 TaxID=2018025 RepID=UPI000CA1E66F|nr:carboxymuconolactone decarboxylase family protein [Kitasatospora sp. MMS16-BH015]AUG75136.1 alkylhydroperoxidase [Kitasatospora sp. MMS16-BH015]
MEARMPNPAVVIPEAMPALLGVVKAVQTGGVPETTMEIVHLRASQINGCSYCVDGGVTSARKAGVSEQQLATVAAWREAPHFSPAERAALALAESATRLADGGGVSDEVWAAAAEHYDERQLAALTLMIGLTNLFNRLNATTRQISGASW